MGEVLDRVDGLIAEGVLDGEQLNCADFQIATSLALVDYRLDVRAELRPRPGRGPGGAGAAVFVVVLTGPPGAGKTVALTALSDSLVDDGIAHAAVDADEVAWAYPFPDLAQRCEHLRAWREPHARAGNELLHRSRGDRVAPPISPTCSPPSAPTLTCWSAWRPRRRRFATASLPASRPAGTAWPISWVRWSRCAQSLAVLDGVHLRLDSERLAPAQISERVRSARPDILGAGAGRA